MKYTLTSSHSHIPTLESFWVVSSWMAWKGVWGIALDHGRARPALKSRPEKDGKLVQCKHFFFTYHISESLFDWPGIHKLPPLHGSDLSLPDLHLNQFRHFKRGQKTSVALVAMRQILTRLVTRHMTVTDIQNRGLFNFIYIRKGPQLQVTM